MAVRRPLVAINGTIRELPTGDELAGAYATGGSSIQVTKYSADGPLEVATGTARWYPETDITILGVYFSLGTAGTTTTSADVKMNGTTILSTLPSATSGVYKSTKQELSTSVTETDYLTVDITAAGTGAEDMTLCIVYINAAVDVVTINTGEVVYAT